jgi:hypothetical protein
VSRDKSQLEEWGPYLSERQWGTVREDYSDGGDAWDYVSHDQARSRAYRWGEDGLAGICDDKQRLCFALGLWNGQDPILKERLFGLTNSQGNHGEDVKEYYFYLDSTPTHSFMKYLYKYPQAAYPYDDLVATNRQRGKGDLEYELLETGVFNDDRYFDVFVEYAKATPEDILIEISVANRGPEAATLHVLPTLWFRNTWSWGELAEKPLLECATQAESLSVVAARWPTQLASAIADGETKAQTLAWATRYLYCDGSPSLLFTENETNTERLFSVSNATQFVKDGINNYIVHGRADAVNSRHIGTKVAVQYVITIGAGESQTLRLRLSDVQPTGPNHAQDSNGAFGPSFGDTMPARRQEADEFYTSITPPSMTDDAANVMRQALAGWTTSACSTAVRRCRQEDTWNRPMVPPGWRSTVRT